MSCMFRNLTAADCQIRILMGANKQPTRKIREGTAELYELTIELLHSLLCTPNCDFGSRRVLHCDTMQIFGAICILEICECKCVRL
jgi:hypothetical protein